MSATAIDYGKLYGMAQRTFACEVNPMPDALRELVLPSPLHMNKTPSERYIPRYDPDSARCWWEWVPPRSERGGRYWKRVQGRSSRRGRRKLAKKDVCMFMDSDDEDEENRAENMIVLNDDLREIYANAWRMYTHENERRAALRDAWFASQRY